MNISNLLTDDEKRLIKRCEELYTRAEQGTPSTTAFLNPRERYIIKQRMPYLFNESDEAPICFFYGGFPDAQRTLLCFFPAYCRYSITEDDSPVSSFRDELGEAILPLKIKSGGFVKLAHRDYLGALIGMGLERSSVGDILVDDDGAIIFVLPSVAGLLKNELTYIGRDKVKVSDISLPEDFNRSPTFDKINGTVASARLDAVVSELANCSRETAKTVIRQGFVEHNHFTADEPDSDVSAGDIISVRKTNGTKGGKFIVDSIDERSAKGRIRLSARRFT